MPLERLRGFRDIYPEDMEIRDRVLDTVKSTARSFGFSEIDIPSVEPLDLYRAKSGEELLGQTFNFRDRSGREVTLLPEATPSVVRMLTARKDLPKPVRWFCLPKIWRYEEPQSGRLREHVQFNADIFGSESEAADAEIIGLACTILDRLGLQGHYEIRMNDRLLMDEILNNIGVDSPREVFSAIDRFHKVTEAEFLKTLGDLGLDEKTSSVVMRIASTKADPKDAMDHLNRISTISDEAKNRLKRLLAISDLVSKYTSSRVVVDLSIVRGLSYYTGLVFEAFDIRGELRAILGGGRYDSLASVIGEQQIPAVGFGMGDVVLELLMKRAGTWVPVRSEKSYYICTIDRSLLDWALTLAAHLRSRGIKTIVDLGDRNISNQLKMASSSGSRYAIIIGQKEVSTGKLTLKDLVKGDQTTVTRDQLPGYNPE
ncbi:MAG TPA: histidine--tRNA ligase [Thermoplasmataceae archaeon]|nr:histidine--tRNA ligase [Thermoplasmataceae archaeon]